MSGGVKDNCGGQVWSTPTLVIVDRAGRVALQSRAYDERGAGADHPQAPVVLIAGVTSGRHFDDSFAFRTSAKLSLTIRLAGPPRSVSAMSLIMRNRCPSGATS